MNLLEQTINFLKKTNIEIDASKRSFLDLFQIDFKKNKPKIISLDWPSFNEYEKNLAKEIIDSNNYIYEDSDATLDAVDKNIWQLIQVILKSAPASFGKNGNRKCLEIRNKNLTIVTGLWDIGRPNRSFETYLEHFENTLKIPNFMFIYAPSSLVDFIWARRDKENTVVKILDFDGLKNFYGSFWEPTQTIRKDPKWYTQAGWLQNSPQAICEWYNPIVQSKMPMLHDVKCHNPFNTDYFIWLDAGITTTVPEGMLIEDRPFDKINQYLDSMLFLSYPYEADKEIHGFEYEGMNRYAQKKVEYVCRGGLFGGHKDFISSSNSMYWNLLNSSLREGLMGTEESIFTIMSYLDPSIHKRYALDDNGLIVKFIQALNENKVELEKRKIKYNDPIGFYNQQLDKTILYVLGFNFPKQFQVLIDSFEKHPEWLSKPRKILINNSDSDAAISEYEQICKKYGFEHIVTGKNLGICGGRQFAAEHFQQTEAKYYMFFEDDMCLHEPSENLHCRNGFRCFVPNLYDKIHHIMAREDFDYLKLSFTEVYMDNNLQVSWYNVPQKVRSKIWPEYDQLPIHGLDFNCPKTEFKNINSYQELPYISGNIYYANWPMIVSKKGNKKMFIDIKWEYPYEQTWMSQIFQDNLEGKYKAGILLASPINHNRVSHYQKEQRKENAG